MVRLVTDSGKGNTNFSHQVAARRRRVFVDWWVPYCLLEGRIHAECEADSNAVSPISVEDRWGSVGSDGAAALR